MFGGKGAYALNDMHSQDARPQQQFYVHVLIKEARSVHNLESFLFTSINEKPNMQHTTLWDSGLELHIDGN
jgi:hypothetical protein